MDMTKQEEIREGMEKEVISLLVLQGESLVAATEMAKALVKKWINYLYSQGVVLKVEKELPKPLKAMWVDWDDDGVLKDIIFNDSQKTLDKAGYVAVEPLI